MLKLIISFLQIIDVFVTMITLIYSTPEEIRRGLKLDFTLANNINLIRAFILIITPITIVSAVIFIAVAIFFHAGILFPEYWALYPIVLTIGVVVILWRVIAAFRHSVK